MSEAPKAIQCKAAVAWAPAQPLCIETVEVAPPGYGEARIKILYTSVCHTDEYTLSGADPEGIFPCILGHEGAGVVESVGPGTDLVSVGDYVVPLYLPQCKECKFCKNPKTNLCQKIRATQGRGVMPDGKSRFTCKGQPVYHYMGTSTFSEYTVLPQISLSKLDHTIAAKSLDKLCLLGCGLSTGYGAALNTANVQPGDNVAIFGLGAVGLAVAVGCKNRGAKMIIGVDINDKKEALSKEFGITHFVNPKRVEADGKTSLLEALVDMTDGGPEHTFECVGNVDLMRTAFECTHKGWGQSIVIGVASAGQEIRTRPFQMIVGRTWKGCAFGGWRSRDSMPKLVQEYVSGALPIDKFITHTRTGISSLNDVFALLKSGESLRCVISMCDAAAAAAEQQ